jgi:DNA-binding HxlR family transcriptional regulator
VKDFKGKTYRCTFELTMNVLSGKWKAIILYHIAENEVLRFSGIRKTIPEITERMLSKQLRELEDDGLVSRLVYNQIPPRVEYRLTVIGLKLIPILNSMKKWGVEYEEYFDGAKTEILI